MSPASDPAYPSDVRSALLTAAHTELLEHGVAGLSLRAIAHRAGVSRATPTWHFGDRAGLLAGVAAEGYRQLGAALAEAATKAGDQPDARLTALGRSYLRFGLDNPQLFDLMFRAEELNADSPELQAAQRESFAVLGQATGALGDDAQLPLLAWAAAHGLVMLLRDGALQAMAQAPSPERAAELADILVQRFTRLATG